MITAKEAAELAEFCVSAKDQKTLEKLDTRIRIAAAEGRRSIDVQDLDITVKVKSALAEMGFKYDSYHDQRDGYDSKTVNW